MSCPVGGDKPVEDSRLSATRQYYADYLQLDKLLSAQRPLSATEAKPEGEHDEMLFLIIHQTFELWFKQVLYELRAVVAMFQQPVLKDTETTRVLHHLTRVCQILKLATNQFDVLETMTPRDFMAFRDYLYPASGFQSFQFRLLENLLGMDPSRRVPYQSSAYHSHLSAEHQNLVLESETAPSLLQGVQRWLERTPFVQLESFDFLKEYRQAVVRMYTADAQLLSKSFDVNTAEGRAALEAEQQKNTDNMNTFLALFDEEKHNAMIASGIKTLSFKATKAALLITLYSEQPHLHVPYLILERIVDIDGLMAQWRYRHALAVHRMIGTKLGTGGSSGYGYLKAVIEPTRVFKDIANLATYVIRPSALPELPLDVQFRLGYAASEFNEKGKEEEKK